MAKILSMAPGDVIMKQGDAGDSVFFVQEGSLNVFIKDENNHPKKIGTIQKGELVGEMAFIEKTPRAATVIAATNCELVQVSNESLELAFAKLPTWLHVFIKTLIRRIKEKNYS